MERQAAINTPLMPGYAWAVHVAHREYMAWGFFDPGSLFHSAPGAADSWTPPECSLQIETSDGESSSRRFEQNSLRVCTGTLFERGQQPLRFTGTNGAAMRLLKTGDVKHFKAEALLHA